MLIFMGESSDTAKSNMDEFEHAAALVLARLYGAFPSPIILEPKQLESGISLDVAIVYADTIDFLAREGFIVHGHAVRHAHRDRIVAEHFLDVVLTSKGLTILNAVPKALTIQGESEAEDAAKKPIGKRLVDAIRKGAPNVAGTLAKTALTEGAKWLAGYYGP